MNYTCMQNVKLLVGENEHKKIGEVLKDEKYNKAFLVYDAGVKATDIIEKVTNSLKASGIEYIEFDKVLPDPPADIVNLGGEICRENGCDCVIGIGGGSAIDTAKGINILRVNGGKILEYASPEREMKCSLGLMSVPTTSGTGSELSNGLIISDTENNTKVAILAENGMSEFAVVDPVFSAGMPLGLTIMTGLDVFSHAAEGYTSILSNPMSDMIVKSIMENVVKYLPRAVKNGNDMEARSKMHVSAALGGWMLANPSAHVGHSIAHVLGGELHIPHGACCAYSLPVVLEEISGELTDKVKDIAEILGASFSGSETPEEIGKIASDYYKKFAYEIVGVKRISEFVSGEVNVEKLADKVVIEPLAGIAPMEITKQNAKNMLYKIFN